MVGNICCDNGIDTANESICTDYIDIFGTSLHLLVGTTARLKSFVNVTSVLDLSCPLTTFSLSLSLFRLAARISVVPCRFLLIGPSLMNTYRTRSSLLMMSSCCRVTIATNGSGAPTRHYRYCYRRVSCTFSSHTDRFRFTSTFRDDTNLM